MSPVRERLDEAATKADGHRDASHPLHLELLQVVQQELELLRVPRRQLVGPFWYEIRVCPVLSLSVDAGLSG
jgi:hypothetical protein